MKSHTPDLSRRSFLKLSAASGATLLLASCSSAGAEKLTFIDRLIGHPLTQLPQIEDAWLLENGRLLLNLSKLPEFKTLGGAVRIEGDALADPLLVVLGEDSNYYAFINACTHAGRMIDPVKGTMTLECCSVSSSTYNYAGEVLSGPAAETLTSYAVSVENDYLSVLLN